MFTVVSVRPCVFLRIIAVDKVAVEAADACQKWPTEMKKTFDKRVTQPIKASIERLIDESDQFGGGANAIQVLDYRVLEGNCNHKNLQIILAAYVFGVFVLFIYLLHSHVGTPMFPRLLSGLCILMFPNTDKGFHRAFTVLLVSLDAQL